MALFNSLAGMYCKCVSALSRIGDRWLLGLTARLTFASVLLVYFINSAITKVGAGFFGFLSPSGGAYAQILPTIAEQFGYDSSQIPFIPYGMIVLLGTWAEFILPCLIVIGLFTRIASAGMIGFIAVMTYVDINFHNADAKTIGAMFDRVADSAISDQRLLWIFPLIYLLVKGGGCLSLDHLLTRGRCKS